MSNMPTVPLRGEVLSFSGRPVRCVIRPEGPRFLHADACRAIGYEPQDGSFHRYAKRLADYEKSTPTREEAQLLWEMGKKPEFSREKGDRQNLSVASKFSSSGNFSRAILLAESALYVLYTTGKDALTPGTPAYVFRRRVFEEVLPSLRTRGFYGRPTAQFPAVKRHSMLLELGEFIWMPRVVEFLQRFTGDGFPRSTADLLDFLEQQGVVKGVFFEGRRYRVPTPAYSSGRWFNTRVYQDKTLAHTQHIGLDCTVRAVDVMLELLDKAGRLRRFQDSIPMRAANATPPGLRVAAPERRPSIAIDEDQDVRSIRFAEEEER